MRVELRAVITLCVISFLLGFGFTILLGANIPGKFTNPKSESVKHEMLIDFGCGEYHSKTGEFVLIRNEATNEKN
jgi:hypothetical protein